MQVPTLSIVLILLDMLLGIAIPVVLAVLLRKKYGAALKPFFIGALTMLVFALVLEQIAHSLILSTPEGKLIQSSLWLMGLYGGLMAGLFEETGRLISMKLLLKKQQNDPHNALMYGAGHGGIEMAAILTIGMLNNAIYAILLNAGKLDVLLAPLDESAQATLMVGVRTLAQTEPTMFLVSIAERLGALGAQLALSVLVWFAATKPERKRYYFLAVGLHFLLDALSAIAARAGISILAIEAVVWLLAALYLLLARAVWKKET